VRDRKVKLIINNSFCSNEWYTW